MIHSSLTRYASLVDAPDALYETLSQPLEPTIWTNTLKTNPEQLEKALDQDQRDWSSIHWYPGGYRMQDGQKPGRSLSYSCGWYVVQEEIAWCAVRALNPQLGDRILDLCAAPGGKTAQLALAVGATGGVVANERSLSRLSALSHTITRLGLTNVISTHSDGRYFQAQPHSFDRILVDVPCSGEGTLRKKAGRRSLAQENWNERHSHRLTIIQKQLLKRALELVKPDGVIVYSTCTFAPEENEAVLDEVLGDRGVVEPWPISGLVAAPGLKAWEEQRFRADMQYAQRYWPHFNDTGGFFVARIRRTHADLCRDDSLTQSIGKAGLRHAAAASDGLESKAVAQTPVRQASTQESMEWMSDRFGIEKSLFQAYSLWSTGQEKEWIADKSCDSLALSLGVPIQTIGLPLARRLRHGFKPTTAALQRFGKHVIRQYLELNPEQCARFMQGLPHPFVIQESSSPSTLGGFIHLKCGRFDLGCGRWKQDMLHSELPKALRLPL